MRERDAVRELAAHLRQAIRVLDSKELTGLAQLAHVHDMPYRGPVADTAAMRKTLDELEANELIDREDPEDETPKPA